MEKHYHTIVVGAGPAGLNAARFLKEEALIVDKKKEIGRPVQCGEGISLQALAREGIAPDDRWIAARIHHVKRIMPNGKYIGERREEPYAVVLRRPLFERHLASLVPWEIRTDVRVTGICRKKSHFVLDTSSGERFHATCLIGADGPHSVVGRSVFRHANDLSPAVNRALGFKNAICDDALQMYFGRRIAPDGYGWVFPTSRMTANVGLLIKQKGNISRFYDRFLDTVVKPVFGDFDMGENKSGTLPTSGFPPSVARGNACLAGDAGGFTDPIFEGGLNMALFTGRLCAEGINRQNPAHYQKCINELPFTGADLVAAQRLFYGFSDDVLNDLGDVLDGHGTSYLNTKEGQTAFAARPNLVKHQKEIALFAQTWALAKPYIW